MVRLSGPRAVGIAGALVSAKLAGDTVFRGAGTSHATSGDDGTVRSWGRNVNGELGDGTEAVAWLTRQTVTSPKGYTPTGRPIY